MANITVDLDDFSLNEILSDLNYRYNSEFNKEINQKKINDFINHMKIDFKNNQKLKNSIVDEQKIDFFMENISKINLLDLEKIIKPN